MSENSNALAAAFAKSQTKNTERPEKVYNAAATPARRGKRGLTLYISPEAHKRLKELALREDMPIQDILREGLNLALQKYGEKPIA